ncbi:Nn.00g005830.m01.CDS01 [Neocucurbitaria sp. VM-36]
MDHIGASLEVINLICTTLVFIRNVTNHPGSASENSRDLDEYLVFLETFSDVCYSDLTGLLKDVRVHHALARDVEHALYSLNKSLAAHREAWRYVGVASDADQWDIEDMTSPSLEVKYERKRWRDGMKERSQIWRERARPGIYGALFGREEMEALISACQTWTSRLRQTLEIILLVVGPPTSSFWCSEEAVTLGVEEVLERQRRAGSRPSRIYNALPGSLRDTISNMNSISGLVKTVYKDENDEVDVLIEIRSDQETPTELLCNLTWLLQAPVEACSLKHDRYQLQTLSCMGFIDDPINNRALILYQSPKSHPWASNPPSLHALLSKGLSAKLSLAHRFLTAKSLAMTVLETHTSGWVHRNISARSIVMLPHTLNDSEPSPYLVGWGVPQPPNTTTFDLEPNLYNHQDRFGRPSSEYTNEHDIYSLGVVLLEIGLWKTMSTVFARRLEKTPSFDTTQQRSLSHRISAMVLDLASGPEIKREMGGRYAEVVVNCLTWHHRDAVEGMLEFRKQVVDGLSLGIKL